MAVSTPQSKPRRRPRDGIISPTMVGSTPTRMEKSTQVLRTTISPTKNGNYQREESLSRKTKLLEISPRSNKVEVISKKENLTQVDLIPAQTVEKKKQSDSPRVTRERRRRHESNASPTRQKSTQCHESNRLHESNSNSP